MKDKKLGLGKVLCKNSHTWPFLDKGFCGISKQKSDVNFQAKEERGISCFFGKTLNIIYM